MTSRPTGSLGTWQPEHQRLAPITDGFGRLISHGAQLQHARLAAKAKALPPIVPTADSRQVRRWKLRK